MVFFFVKDSVAGFTNLTPIPVAPFFTVPPPGGVRFSFFPHKTGLFLGVPARTLVANVDPNNVPSLHKGFSLWGVSPDLSQPMDSPFFSRGGPPFSLGGGIFFWPPNPPLTFFPAVQTKFQNPFHVPCSIFWKGIFFFFFFLAPHHNLKLLWEWGGELFFGGLPVVWHVPPAKIWPPSGFPQPQKKNKTPFYLGCAGGGGGGRSFQGNPP